MEIIELNDTAKTICGLSRKECIGKSFDSIPKTCSGQCIEAVKKTILEKQSLEVNRVECNHRIRKRQMVTLNTFPLIDHIDGRSGCVMIVKDETCLSNLEEKLEKRHGKRTYSRSAT